MIILKSLIGRFSFWSLACYFLVPGMLFLCLPGFTQSSPGSQALLMGVVTNGATGTPIVGARVVVNGKSAWSTSGGIYSLAVTPAGSFPVACTKPGYENYTSAPILFQPGVTSMLNMALLENTTPPATVSAMLDTIQQKVAVSWLPPSGGYEILYDDGIQDNFTVWSSQGNMNALKFTPAGYPVKVTGGSIHIGAPGNYPAGSNPLVPFQVRIYDASGPGGAPGNSLAGPFEIVPAAFGWVEFNLPSPVIIGNGSWFIAMVQGGNTPNAAGIAIDETTPQFRSYSRFVTGGGPWFPAGGNFMIRARCEGPGGPMFVSDAPQPASLYHVYRLRQGEEQNPQVWTFLGAATTLAMPDTSWSALPCGPYRWGVKAQYPGNRWSPAAFSNILGKCWTAPVTIQLIASCETTGSAGASMRLVNQAYPDTAYSAIFDSTGLVSLPAVWKGSYLLTVVKFGYDTLKQTVPVVGTVSLNLNLLQVRVPPVNLEVSDSSLMARWDVPRYEKHLFSEQWTSGSFTTNNWTREGGANWTISSAIGNPAPSAEFNGTPQVMNYNQSLISRTIAGERSTLLKLKYDLFLDNAGTTTMNQMAVELWDGVGWNLLENYNNNAGSFPWISGEIDISAYTDANFKIRFRAYGGDSFDINNWNIDNIAVVASEPAQQQANCILGYYFYLGNAIIGYTTKTAFPIPGNMVQFGQTYNACVRALYGSGYSDYTCTSFTSRFLYPARNITGYPIENVAYFAWEKPVEINDTATLTPAGLAGYNVYRGDSLIAQISDPDSLSVYDTGLEPGIYLYGVTAIYDLTSYGFPGQMGESLPDGPLNIVISYGIQIPFLESWNQGIFNYNDWRFEPSQGNWVMDTYEGLPQPAAKFKWQPPQVNYSFALESPPFNGVPFGCAAIWLDFDLKLDDRNATGKEKMIVEAWYNNEWHKKAEIKNSGSLPWTNYHIDISPVRGKGFRVRFRAAGQNSSDILNWYIDNIYVYPVCYPATQLSAATIGNTVSLTWSPPACYGGNLLNEGFESAVFPPPEWTRQVTNGTATWSHISGASPLGAHSGNFSAGLNWDYNHQDEWLIAEDVYVNGDLTFWSYAFQGSLHQDHYYVKVSPDQGATWDVLLDLSALPPYPGAAGVNAWNTPYRVDLSMYEGETVDIAWHAVDGDGNGLWYPWAIDDCTIGADDGFNMGSVDLPVPLVGYDIYRKSPGSGAFVKINTDVVNDTTWLDPSLPLGQYRYFVQSRFSECANATNSDTVMVDIITGIESLDANQISIYPNPASGYVTITSHDELGRVELYDTSGSLKGTWISDTPHSLTIDTHALPDGLYLISLHIGPVQKSFKVILLRK